MTTVQIEKEMKKLGICKNSAKFYSPDGSLYAKSSRIDSIMELPFFRLTIDDNLQYSVNYTKPLREIISVMSPNQKQFYDQIRSYNITDAKARPLSRLCQLIYKKTEDMNSANDCNKKWNHRDFGLILRDSIAQLSC